MSERGKFIVFEGIDGCGKSTQARMLAKSINERLEKAQSGHRCFVEEEPDSREILGGLIRSALHGGYKVKKDVLAYLYAANRIEHISRMLPVIEAGNHIVCDRYFFSNMAYNRTADLDMKYLYELNRPFAQKLVPDLVFFVALSPEAAHARINSRGEEEIFDKLDKQREISANYDEVFEYLKQEIKTVRVDGSMNIEALAGIIDETVIRELGI